MSLQSSKLKKIVVLGGGTGSFAVLSGLKKYPINLSVIVSMMDSGGSTGRLRDQLGVLPPGDLRQCLVALSDAPLLWRKLFLYRFETGELKGHNFGNLLLSALEKTTKTYDEVIKTASFVLKTKGNVIPVTFNKCHLGVKYNNGLTLKGQGKIDVNAKETSGIKKAFLEPEAFANPQALDSILKSDYIIIAPGDLYTSIIPIFLVKQITESIKKSKAKIIFIVNMMTKSGQTNNFKTSNFLNVIKKYLKKTPDYILINNGPIPKYIIQHYNKAGEKPIINDLKQNKNTQLIFDNFVNKKIFKTNSFDSLTRSVLRHNPKKVAEAIIKIVK
jgi:uncharacterized cofD-like protein